MNIWVIFPILALVLGVLVSVCLFIKWLSHGKRPRFILYWALALFLMYWFQVPVILTNLGRVITVTDFSFFFALTLPITFLALTFIYLGAVEISGLKLSKKFKLFLGAWFLSSVIFFASQFIGNGGIIRTYALPLVGNIVFYLPMRILIILTMIRWLFRPDSKTFLVLAGAGGIILESLLGISRNFMIIKSVLAYPPEYWYIALMSLKIFFILQTFSVIFVALGFFFFCKAYYRAKK